MSTRWTSHIDLILGDARARASGPSQEKAASAEPSVLDRAREAADALDFVATQDPETGTSLRGFLAEKSAASPKSGPTSTTGEQAEPPRRTGTPATTASGGSRPAQSVAPGGQMPEMPFKQTGGGSKAPTTSAKAAEVWSPISRGPQDDPQSWTPGTWSPSAKVASAAQGTTLYDLVMQGRTETKEAAGQEELRSAKNQATAAAALHALGHVGLGPLGTFPAGYVQRNALDTAGIDYSRGGSGTFGARHPILSGLLPVAGTVSALNARHRIGKELMKGDKSRGSKKEAMSPAQYLAGQDSGAAPATNEGPLRSFLASSAAATSMTKRDAKMPTRARIKEVFKNVDDSANPAAVEAAFPKAKAKGGLKVASGEKKAAKPPASEDGKPYSPSVGRVARNLAIGGLAGGTAGAVAGAGSRFGHNLMLSNMKRNPEFHDQMAKRYLADHMAGGRAFAEKNLNATARGVGGVFGGAGGLAAGAGIAAGAMGAKALLSRLKSRKDKSDR